MMDRAFFDNYLGAWNAHDSAAVARYMADDAIYEDVALGRVLHGPSEIASFVEEGTRSSSDFRFTSCRYLLRAPNTRMNGACSGRMIARCVPPAPSAFVPLEAGG